MLTYLGKRAVRSVATEMEFADMLTPIDAIKKAVAQKNAAARPPCSLFLVHRKEIEMILCYLRCPLVDDEKWIPL
jgi:hypothetical protein